MTELVDSLLAELARVRPAVECLREAWRGLEYELLDLPPNIAAVMPGSSFDQWFNKARMRVRESLDAVDR